MTVKEINPEIIGIIGGTGLYHLDELQDTQWVKMESHFGKPSDKLLTGQLKGVQMIFLPRHARGHTTPAHMVNYRANIEVLKKAGVSRILSFSAVGSLKETIHPGDFIIVDQYLDRAVGRNSTFFEDGIAAHVSMANPTCPEINSAIHQAFKPSDLDVRLGGTYLTINGPQFSTRAESKLYRSWNLDIIGMTNMPEAKLAREAEICYTTIAMVTDYDCWHPHVENVSTSQVLTVLRENVDKARRLITETVPAIAALPKPCAAGCDRALDGAIATSEKAKDPATVEKLSTVAGRAFKELWGLPENT